MTAFPNCYKDSSIINYMSGPFDAISVAGVNMNEKNELDVTSFKSLIAGRIESNAKTIFIRGSKAELFRYS